MELERENKRLKVLIIILLVFLVAFGGYYFYENVVLVNNTDNEKANDIITSENVQEDAKDNTWTNYLLNADNLKIKLTNMEDVTDKADVKELSTEESKEYLEKMASCKIEQLIINGGLGGPELNRAEITYNLNDQLINFDLSNGKMFIINYQENVDNYLIYLLSKDSKKVVREENGGAYYQIFNFDNDCATTAIKSFFE